MQQPTVTLAVLNHNGMAMRSVMHRGRTFVAGEQGERYEIQLTNNSAGRVEAVVSVDGRDVVSGKLGDFRTQRGYVLEPFQTITVDGFRRSMDHVAAFRFSTVDSSFSGRMGTPQNTGVIGLAVFAEKPARMNRDLRIARKGKSGGRSHVPFDPAPSAADRAAPTPRVRGGATKGKKKPARRPGTTSSTVRRDPDTEVERQELGTLFGETRMSQVRNVSFQRRNATRPDFRTAVIYDSARALSVRGVPIEPRPIARPMERDPFPAASATEFTQPPPMMRRHRR